MTQEKQGDGAPLSEEQCGALLSLARTAIARKLGAALPEGGEAEHASRLAAKELQEKRGTFVTLKLHGRLRGCIGSLAPCESIVEGVRRNALNAAFCDSRFSPLTSEELPEVVIEVSILSEAKPLAYSGGEDLLARLRPGRDGVILGRGSRCATFLPQVWEQLPRTEDFLSQLCCKAGLPPSAWRQGDLAVSIYTVRHFSETPRNDGT